MKLSIQEIYIFNKTSFLKSEKYNQGKTDLDKEYWYRIEYLYKDKQGNLVYNWEFIDKEDYNNINVDGVTLGNPIKVRGHYQQYKFKCDELV